MIINMMLFTCHLCSQLVMNLSDHLEVLLDFYWCGAQ